MVILEIKELTKDFLGLRAVNNISVDVREKEIFGLIGPNGSGKTTLFNLITGFLKPTKGSIFYKGQLISGKEPYEIANLGLLRTFQLVNLFTNLTVEENIIAGCHLISTDSFMGSFFCNKGFRKSVRKIGSKAKEIMEFLNLTKYKNTIAKSLPLGEERKLELGITLASNPSFLLLDEQWAGMNQKESVELSRCIKNIRDEVGMTIVVVEHNMSVVMELCDRIAVLNYGSKIAEGTPREIAHNETVISVYLGRQNEDSGN